MSHSLEPSSEVKPTPYMASHSRHCVPSSFGIEPFEQNTHEVEPVFSATFPLSHELHVGAPWGAKVPTSQSSHRVASSLGTEPSLHTSHVDAPVFFATVPLSHELHVEAPSGEKVPGLHGSQFWAPFWFVNVPAALEGDGGVGWVSGATANGQFYSL